MKKIKVGITLSVLAESRKSHPESFPGGEPKGSVGERRMLKPIETHTDTMTGLLILRARHGGQYSL